MIKTKTNKTKIKLTRKIMRNTLETVLTQTFQRLLIVVFHTSIIKTIEIGFIWVDQ